MDKTEKYRILAIIPARAGSVGIPNKNIRLVNGHPLIYYSVKNAMNSEYITDTIITTDSPEVKVIAKQMGIKIRNRNQKLCEDSITLDEVVYDAIPSNSEWDYIVTMQPTSPTLSCKTLDRAIEFAIKNDLDTLISVINKPHLSWSEIDGRKIPNYEKRLNRQYLPPYFIETGAFLISKGSIITKKSRIGNKIDVFEIPEEESQDIDSFSDLRNVIAQMDQKKVAIYVNGNKDRGLGHIYRALELADEFFSKPDIYYDRNQTNIEVFGKTKHNLIAVNGITELFEKCRLNNYTVFINDILSTSVDYMIGLRTVLPNAKIINFEDDGEGIIKADLVFNALYQENNIPNVYSGEKYYISGKTFLYYEPIKIKENVEKVFISFGGSDPQNYTDRILNIISKKEFNRYRFTVVLGRIKKGIDKLLQYNKFDNIEVLHDVGNMPELMSSCDVAVTSRGRTGYELAILGIPSIAMAQNEREEKHAFVSNENGFTYIGLNPDDEIIEGTLKMYLTSTKQNRTHFQEKLLSHDLRNGRKRVFNLINED
ncbi:MAG: hypothetical protein E6Y30_01965 [Finegoldia magna]|nr:hypothetical protein [Finegoldia magna]